MKTSQLIVKSDGTTNGTTLETEDGTVIKGVQEFKFSASAFNNTTELTIKLTNVRFTKVNDPFVGKECVLVNCDNPKNNGVKVKVTSKITNKLHPDYILLGEDKYTINKVIYDIYGEALCIVKKNQLLVIKD